MGQFSWIYADKVPEFKEKGRVDGVYMPDNCHKDSYLLIPEPFQKTYGKWVKAEYYSGYGTIGCYDAYELAAIFNRKYLTVDMLIEPTKSLDGCLEESRISNINRYVETVRNLLTYRYTGKYSGELRDLGIDIACYDEQNAKLPYPIKITSKPMAYDEVGPSLADPGQGWDEDDKKGEK